MLIESIFATSASLIVYHHLGYPLALRALTTRAGRARYQAPRGDREPPTITVIVPVHNEERFIGAKIRNCASLDHSAGSIEFVVVCDGCTDSTAKYAAEAIAGLGAAACLFRLVVHTVNRGKVCVLNEAISNCGSQLVALTDASAALSPDALKRAARAFEDPDMGFVTGAYSVPGAAPTQQSYWRYQTEVKRREAKLGSPIGAHGAFYVFRREAWRPCEPDTINDDVILPMRIVERGYRGLYDRAISIAETEVDRPADDLRRRERLGAGAIQQALRLWRLADPRRPGIAFTFLSGKALRAFIPFLLVVALVSSLALSSSSLVFAAMLAAQLLLYGVAGAAMVSRRIARLPGVGELFYLVAGYTMSGLGAVRYLAGGYRSPWMRADGHGYHSEGEERVGERAARGKRILDIVVASLALVVFTLLFIPIAAAIKIESRGPVFYRQLRVGLRTPRESRLFYLTKFRTMRADAELRSGAVWATERDPRITRVGYFLRKTRLDELPQCIDVLRGDMSIVGPRPERPQFFNRLEREIPFYAERTYGVKPGITGLAQVLLPYDSSIEDVRAKVLQDHTYALHVLALGRWLSTDLGIIFRTFSVMILGKGR